jgi:3-hydroxybutyryl-CoA dehydrogenase
MAVPDRLTTVAVIGNGIIGHGVAQLFALAGRDVILVGRSHSSLERATTRIRTSLDDFVAHGLATAEEAAAAAERITPTTELEAAVAAELVIEAVTQDVPLKLEIFERLDRICAPPTVLGTSSGQPASELVERVRERGRVLATHFWYPPQLIPLVEVCAGPETDADVVPWTCEALRQAGKEPVVIDREVPGFIGNRLQFALLREAWSLWASGAASAEAIDAVARTSFGRRLAVTGPLESADLGGLDTMVAFAEFLQPHLDVSPLPPDAVRALPAGGHHGVASGRGVHDWSRRDGAALLRERTDELFRWLAVDRVGA